MAKIRFIRERTLCTWTMYDIIYESGRTFSCRTESLPKTAQDFLANAKHKVLQHDSLFNRDEIIYSNGLKA